MSVDKIIEQMAKAARTASRVLARCPTAKKNEVLLKIADEIVKNQAYIKKENKKDLTHAKKAGLSSAFIDRLTIKDATIKSMADELKEVSALEDPVGSIVKTWKRPNGIEVSRMRIPLGVIGIIYESRPNVTIDAAGLCLKAGNAVILRGGSDAFHSNQALAGIIKKALSVSGMPEEVVQVVPVKERIAVNALLSQEEYVDLIIPRGGEELIRFVVKNSSIPVLKHYKGVCHVYVDESADIDMARKICFNSKVQRPGVCNALETILVHKNAAKNFLPQMAKDFKSVGVEIRGCNKTCKIIKTAKKATEEDWPAEYLDLIIAVKIVDDMDEAISHIEKYGSNHTESIVTSDYGRARRFTSEVDSSLVLVNASTRFNDGGQLGLGAEIGISTSKLHAFGPMGLEELTTTKFIALGNGQIRE